jgi:hypothetical protein
MSCTQIADVIAARLYDKGRLVTDEFRQTGRMDLCQAARRGVGRSPNVHRREG